MALTGGSAKSTPRPTTHSGGSGDSAELRGRVERTEGHFEGGPRDGWRWVTYRTYLDGVFLGNAVDEAEGWRWIDDMLKLEAHDA